MSCKEKTVLSISRDSTDNEPKVAKLVIHDHRMTNPLKKPELMSPAGYWPQLQTAVESGADAVYFGLKHFTARSKVGFELEELPEVMQTLHGRGVKGFLTFNTLVFDHELRQAELAIQSIAAAGVDAVIVQDTGIVDLIRRTAPDLEIHGSTQMSITSAQGAEFAAKLGCRRVVLGRELSLDDIRRIAEATDVELEVFVHGALCVSYSGQCFSSEAWGGRSANRGKCAQACRLSYDLIVDDQARDLGPYRYLLSPGDLCAIEQIPDLMRLGIACVKIEGRYKDANYVAMTTRAYRDAIDLAAIGETGALEPQQRLDLEQIYSRGLGAHFMSGTDHQSVVDGRAPRHRGLLVGVVKTILKPHSVVIDALLPLHRGDGLVFDAADWRSPDEPEEGGRIYDVASPNDDSTDVEITFGRGDVDLDRIRVGDRVWRTHDPQLIKRLKPLTQNQAPVFTRPLSFRVIAHLGKPLRVIATPDLQPELQIEYEHNEPLVAASNRALDEELLQDKLGRLGGTPYHLGAIELETSGDVFVPTSLINQVRRSLVEAAFEAQSETEPIATFDSGLEDQLKSIRTSDVDSTTRQPVLHVLVRTPEQLDALLNMPQRDQLASITLDYLELYGLRPAIERIQSAGVTARVASPRILKPAEQNVIRFLISLDCEILIRSTGLLHDLIQLRDHGDLKSEHHWIGDFSLNVANALSADQFLSSGLERITPTFDLNAMQIEELSASVSSRHLEVIGFSHLPVFHTEHCVFCRFLSEGTDNTNCGHPCEKHKVAVRDQQGRAHPVMADVGCRNTVFGAEAQTDIDAMERWFEKGIEHIRIELVHESGTQTEQITTLFLQFLNHDIEPADMKQRLDEVAKSGVTQGSLFVAADFKDLVQLQ
ncbi:MAG: DUF3656 domain-containing protein [Planctomycetota bacterium]